MEGLQERIPQKTVSFPAQAAHPIRGWGSRTGGVIVAAQPAEVCGVMFEANTLRSNQQVRRRNGTRAFLDVGVVTA